MANTTPPAAQAHLQNRLLNLLLAAIYGMDDTLFPTLQTIAHTPNRPWVERTRFTNRFWAIIRELIALTTRIKPENLTTNPIFPTPRPRAPRPTDPAPRIRAPFATAPLSPLQLAKRLAALLHQLECLAAEVGLALTATFHQQANLIRAIAGCDLLPPQTWERTG